MPQTRSDSFTVRPPRLDDAQDIANLLNTCSVERTGKPSTSVQAVRSILQMPSVDLEADTLLALGSEGQLAGFAFVQIYPPNPLIHALTELHPQYWDIGIGTMLCGWIEERARRSIPELESGERIALLQKRLSTDVTGRDLLIREGYQVVRYNFRMAIELDAPLSQKPLPEGIIIRPFVREAEGRALVRALR